VVWSRLDQNEAALADLRRAAEISRGDAAISLESARLEARLQLFKEAIVSLDQIGADADMNTVKEATELRWSIARSQGGDTQALAKLRLLSEARPDDAPLRFQLARWEAERGNSDRVLPFLRQRVAEEKDAVLREQWRRVLVDALQYHGLADEAVRAAVDGALAAEVGSATEEEFIADLVGTFQQRRFEGAITPSPAEVATALAKRPTALLAMADVMRLRGEGAAAVEVVASLAGAQPDNGALAFIWADLLADEERFAEAIEVLKSRIAKKPDDASAHGRLAVILREAGRESEGAKLLQEWAVTSKPDEVRIRKVAALLPLFLPAVEVKAWTDAATKNLPKPKRIEIRKGVLVESVPPEIQQIEKSGDPAEKRIGQLLELRRRLPKSDSVALALVKAFISAGREPEAWHVMISRHERCEEAEETRKWWRDVVSLEQTFGSLHSQPVLSRLQDMRREQNENANYWAAIAEVATLSGDMNSRIVAQTEELRLSPSDVGLRLELADALAESGATADARRMVAPLLRGPLAAKALVFLACLELSSGRFDSAERILVEVIDDPSSDARDMEELAVRLMGWRRWTMATALLDAQRTVHPKDYRLACLHGIALKEGGDLESAAAVFLGLGAFRDEINDRPAHKLLLRRYFGEVQPYEGKSSDPMSVWLELSRAVQVGLNYQGAMSAMVGERRSRGMEQTLSLAPMQVNECGARAMAHLMNLAREATVGDKAALTQRARAAGLPLPEALLIGKLERQNDATTLVLDEEAVRNRISEPVMANLWISNRRMAARRDSRPRSSRMWMPRSRSNV
jgi:tetratricopeptide (TPR) repeat protein